MSAQKNQSILKRQKELQDYLHELELIRAKPGHMLSPISGILEKQELEKINKILEAMGYPT